jgi:hypothetical protein
LAAPIPLGGDDVTLKPERFSEVYAADLDPAHAPVTAASRRPIEPAALGEQLPGEPAWRALPSWALVSTRDLSLSPAILRLMPERAGSRTAEVESSPAAQGAQPAAVTNPIPEALRPVSPSTDAVTR